MTDSVFKSYSQYYDLLYLDKNYAAEASYILSLLKRYGITKGTLLEFGSGTGKHGRLLAAEGYIVHGIERSADMVAAAQITPGFTCQWGDISDTNMRRQYNAILSLFHVMSYQTSNDQFQAVFTNASRHLALGGIFIFDFWYSPAVYTQKPVVRIKRMADTRVEITRIAEPVIIPNENRVDVKYTIYVHDLAAGSIQTLQETHPMRHFSLPEVDMWAEQHGFERVAAEEFLSGDAPSEKTWGVCAILKKIR